MYQPTIWSHEFIESIDCNFQINNMEMVNELEKKVMMIFDRDYEGGNLSTLQLLELIDTIENLGLGYRFQDSLRRVLDKIASMNEYDVGLEDKEDSLHAMSLRFRLLRQHGYNVSQDFIWRFKDSEGCFLGYLHTDCKGLLSLYEASNLAFEGEIDLDEAKMLRLQTRWYIDAYSKRKDASRLLLYFATLDFNMVQSLYKQELQEVSKWWRDIGLARKLGFIRDRLMECYFWTVGIAFEPQFRSCRVGLTKIGTLITMIDDIYDVYGSQDELKVFTDAVKRWDISAVKQMPEYLESGFVALYNTVNEMGSSISITQGENITPILVKVWVELLDAFFVEKKWSDDKYTPTLENYLDVAWRSVSGVVILTHGYFLINQDIKKDAVSSLEKYQDLFKWSSMIFRLYNDWGTSLDEMKRGETVNAITCYMHEKDVCEEAARGYIKTLIDKAWMKLIELQVVCCQKSPDPFVDMAINIARLSHCTYHYGDGYGAPDARAKNQVLSVIIEPITIRDKEDYSTTNVPPSYTQQVSSKGQAREDVSTLSQYFSNAYRVHCQARERIEKEKKQKAT